MKIFKYPLEIIGEQHIGMPKGAEILCAQTVKGQAFLWALIDPEAKEAIRVIRIFGTGHNIVLKRERLHYIGTVQQQEGLFIWHIFEETK